MPDCSHCRHVLQFFARRRTPQHESAAAHVTPANERNRENQPFSETFDQRLHVFRGGNTSKKYDLAVASYRFSERSGIAFERCSIPRLVRTNIDSCQSLELGYRQNRIGRQQARPGSDNERRCDTLRRRGECLAVSNFAPKIQTADECVDVPDWCARGLYSLRQFETRDFLQQQPTAFASGVCRGKQKYLTTCQLPLSLEMMVFL